MSNESKSNNQSSGASNSSTLALPNIRLCIASPDVQTTTTDNTTRILSGTLHAVGAVWFDADYRIRAYSEKAILKRFLNDYRKHFGLVRIGKQTRTLLNALIANMVHSLRVDRPVLYSRNTADYGNRILKQIIDFMAVLGMVQNVIGKQNDIQKNSSFFMATDKFSQFSEREKIRVQLSKDASFLILRDKDKNEIEIKKTKANRLQLMALSQPVSSYNELWTRHDATVAGRAINPFLRRIFTRELSNGGRWYGGGDSHLQLEKEERPHILIDDCITFEPDYSALHYALLYAKEGIELSSDPYEIAGFKRSTIKVVSLILLNSESLPRFINNINNSANPENQELFKTEPNNPKLYGFIKGVPVGTNGAELLAAIKEKHAPIAHYFGTKDIGLQLQRLDSDIMATCVSVLAPLNIPILPVHDSLVARVIDKKQVLNAMTEAYRKHTGFTPNISVS